MTEWNKTGEKIANDTDMVKPFLVKTGAKIVNHYSLVFFGEPTSIEFLENITTIDHSLSAGDKLSKLAHEHYGDAKFWWVLAWFNGKPTDHHCNLGDVIKIPFPLEEVLLQAYGEE